MQLVVVPKKIRKLLGGGEHRPETIGEQPGCGSCWS